MIAISTATATVPAAHMKLGLPDAGSRPTDTTERRSYDLLTDGFGPGYNGPLTVVVDAPKLDRVQQARVAKDVVKELEGMPGVAEVSAPAANPKGDLTIVTVTPKTGPASDGTKDLVELMRDRADEIPASSGVAAYVTGTTALNIDTADQLGKALPKYVAVVVGLALLLLMVVFRSILVPVKAAAGFLLSIGASMGLVVWMFQDGHLGGLFSVSQAGPIVSFLPVLLIGPAWETLNRSLMCPSWKTQTTSPIDAAMLSRKPSAALIGTRIERNTTVRSSSARPTTTAM